MTGYSTYMKFKRLEEEVTALGLEMVGSKYNGQTLSVAGTYGNDNITIRIPEDPTSNFGLTGPGRLPGDL